MIDRVHRSRGQWWRNSRSHRNDHFSISTSASRGVVWIIASYICWAVYDVHVWRRRPRKINDSAGHGIGAYVLLEKPERRMHVSLDSRIVEDPRRKSGPASRSLSRSRQHLAPVRRQLSTLPIRGQRQSLTFKPAVGRGSLVSVVFVRARRKIDAARCAVAAATCNVVMWRARDFYHTTSTSTSTTTSVRRDSHRVAASTRSRRVRFRSVSSSSQFRPFRLFPSGNVRFSRVFPRDRRPRGYASSGEAELTPVHVRDDRVGWYSTLHRRQQPSRASFSLLGLSLSSLSISLSVSLRT